MPCNVSSTKLKIQNYAMQYKLYGVKFDITPLLRSNVLVNLTPREVD